MAPNTTPENAWPANCYDCSGYHCLTCRTCLAGPSSKQNHADQGHQVRG